MREKGHKEKMKKITVLIFAACLFIAAFAGCGENTKVQNIDLPAMATDLKDNGGFSDILSPVEKDVAAKLYGVDASSVSDSQVYCSTKATTEEIGLFKCADEASAEKLLAAAEARVESQRTTYSSYAPAEMPKLDDAIVKQSGDYIVYIVSADSAKAKKVLDKYLK